MLSNICRSHCLGFCFKSGGAFSNIILCQTLSSESKSNRAFHTVALQNQKLGSTGGCTGVKKTENGGWCRTLFVVSHQLAGVPCSNARHVLLLCPRPPSITGDENVLRLGQDQLASVQLCSACLCSACLCPTLLCSWKTQHNTQ